MDGFVASLLAMTENISSHSRGAESHPRCSANHPQNSKRAQGMPGAQCTRGRVCNKKHTR
jgi:hypothetical protein